MWFQTEIGLRQIPIVDANNACYFAKFPVEEADSHIRFINLIMKRAYWPDLVHFERGIFEDIHNLAASVSKINLFHETWLFDKEKVTSRFVTTELEYIFKVCRSLYDLLQEVISKVWARFQYIDTKKTTKKLGSTFSKMLYKRNVLSTKEEIAKRYLLPLALADLYFRQGQFFDWLRNYRDRISHGGNNIDLLFITDIGFAISTRDPPFNALDFWRTTDLQKNGSDPCGHLLPMSSSMCWLPWMTFHQYLNL